MTTPELQLFTAKTSEAREEAYWELLDRFAWEQKVDEKHLDALREKDPEHKRNHLNLLYSINALQAREVFSTVYEAICKAYGTDNPKEVGVSQVEEAVTLYARSLMPKTTNFAEIEQKVISNVAALLEEKPQTAEEWEEAYDSDPIGFTEEADLGEEKLWVQAGHMVKISIDNTVLDENQQWVEVPYWVVTITPLTHAGQEIRYTDWAPVEAEFAPGQAGNETKLAELVNQALAL